MQHFRTLRTIISKRRRRQLLQLCSGEEYLTRMAAHIHLEEACHHIADVQTYLDNWRHDTSQQKWLRVWRHTMADEFRIFIADYNTLTNACTTAPHRPAKTMTRRNVAAPTAAHNKITPR